LRHANRLRKARTVILSARDHCLAITSATNASAGIGSCSGVSGGALILPLDEYGYGER